MIRHVSVTLAILAFVCCAALAAAGEKIVLPEAVAKAVGEAFPNVAIGGIEMEKEAGFNIYNIELKTARVEMEVAEDGTVMEITTFVDLKDVPAPAAAVIEKAAQGAAIREIEKAENRAEIKKEGKNGRIVKLDNPSPVYEVEIAKGKKTGAIAVAPDGRIVEPLKWKSGGGDEAKIEKIDPANFQTAVDNPFFPLVPGTVYLYTETLGKNSSENEVTVTNETKTIMGVTCVVVHDVLREKGIVMEETFDWYAQDKQGNVWYFGEATKEFRDKGKVITEGSWEAGVKGALPGIIMNGRPAVGEPYRQEYCKGAAEDMGQIVGVDESATVPYGSFTGCVKTKDWSMLEPGHEFKWYARGVGCIRAESAAGEVSVLMSMKRP
jgi:hypothetical protein